MKCPKCGFVEITAGKTCRYCGSSLQQSILIPFPITQATPHPEVAREPQTDWRVELRQRIQAIRARRGIAAAMQEAALDRPIVTPKPEERAKPTNPIVEAALKRLRRAATDESKDSSMAWPSQTVGDDVMLRIGNKSCMAATVTAASTHRQEVPTRTGPLGGDSVVKGPLAYVETRPLSEPSTQIERPLRQPTPPGAPDTSQDELAQAEWQAESSAMPEWVGAEEQVHFDEVPDDPTTTDIEPCTEPGETAADYEVGSVELSLPQGERSREFQVQTATFWQRVRSGVLDVVVMIFVNIPFAALVELGGGNFADRRIQLVLGCMASILYVFYVTLMLATAGQTIGMMVTGIVAVDARSLNFPTVTQAMRRAIGPMLAAVPLMLGFLFPALDAQRRSVSDMISGTTVKQAFEEMAEVEVPWLYHHVRP